MEDSANFTKLMYEQDRVLKSNEECQKVRDKLKEDYLKLRERLQTLPDNVSEEVMIPVGKVAYFPGRLVHTNEIMVLLGDNWFAERSAKQAIEIIDRRVALVQDQLIELKKEEVHIKSQKEYTDELLGLKEGRGGVKEIHEELPDEDDVPVKGGRRKAHAAKHDQVKLSVKFKDNRELTRELAQDTSRPNADSIDHNELMARLNQLEKEEQEEEERQHEEQMKKIRSGEYSRGKKEDDRGGTGTSQDDINTSRRHVKFNDLNSSNSYSYDSDDEEPSRSGNTIRFSHTPEANQVHRERSASESDLRKTINTPADLFDHFGGKAYSESGEKPLKSILKKDSRSNSTENLKLRPILKTSPEHEPGTPEQISFDDPRPILKTPPDSQGSDRRPGTPEYTLSDDPRPILKSSSLDSQSNLGSFDLDSSDPKPILKFADSQDEIASNLSCESDGDETKSILKTSAERVAEDTMSVEKNYTQPDNVLSSFQDEFRPQRTRNESPKRKTILKNAADSVYGNEKHVSERLSGQNVTRPFGVSEVVERSTTSVVTPTQTATATAANKRPVSRFKASRSSKQ